MCRLCCISRYKCMFFNPLDNAIGSCLHSLIKHALFSIASCMSIQTFTLTFWHAARSGKPCKNHTNKINMQMSFSEWFACVKRCLGIIKTKGACIKKWQLFSPLNIQQYFFLIDIYFFRSVIYWVENDCATLCWCSACALPLPQMRNPLPVKKKWKKRKEKSMCYVNPYL